MEKEGKAYGFFYCNASKEAIESELPTIREMSKTPSNLELSLTEGMDNLKGNSKLTALAQRAKKEDGINYVLEAKYSNKTNEDTAHEMADILRNLYVSPLYKDKEQFRGAVVYANKGEYVFRE